MNPGLVLIGFWTIGMSPQVPSVGIFYSWYVIMEWLWTFLKLLTKNEKDRFEAQVKTGVCKTS